jgi:hypothetical protein
MTDRKPPTSWLSLDFPSGLVIEDPDGNLWRIPEGEAFEGDRRALVPIRPRGDPQFPSEMFLDLVGVAEIARRAPVAPGTVHAWRARHHDFPVPLAELSSGPVWAWSSIERWLALEPPSGRPAAIRVPLLSPAVRAFRNLRGDGSRRTFELRDRMVPGSLDVQVDGQHVQAQELPNGRGFSLVEPPPSGSDIGIDYSSMLG